MVRGKYDSNSMHPAQEQNSTHIHTLHTSGTYEHLYIKHSVMSVTVPVNLNMKYYYVYQRTEPVKTDRKERPCI